MTMFVQLATVQAKERMTVLLAINAKELVAIQNSTGMTIMSKQIDALKLAFEALKENQHLVADNQPHAYVMEYNSIIEKCEEALAQPEQKPVAYFNPQVKGGFYWAKPTKITAPITVNVEPMPLYTFPPQPKEPEQPAQQEPVAWQWCGEAHFRKKIPKHSDISDWSPLYRTPQRTWVGLTEEEINEVFGADIRDEQSGELRFIRAIEAKLKEKNT